MKYVIIYDDETQTVKVTLPNGKVGVAKCCPDDAFNLSVGFELACERARKNKVKAKHPIKTDEEYIPKVGDRVRFKDWDTMAKEFGVLSNGSINTHKHFSTFMKHLCGTYATVTEVFARPVSGYFIVDLGHFSVSPLNEWEFTSEMVEKVGRDKRYDK